MAELNPTAAIVEAGGVGYQLIISLNTYTALQGLKEAKVYAFEVIREDSHLLYGFSTKEERELFTLLISVSGVGGMIARMLLSAFSPRELAGYIQNEDVKMLKSVKGIGPKAAQRLVVELRDKVATLFMGAGSAVENNAVDAATREVVEEAVAALTMLGFPPAPSKKVVDHIIKEQPALSVEQIIKAALKML